MPTTIQEGTIPTIQHEAPLELLRHRPRLALELLRDVARVPIPPEASRTRSIKIIEADTSNLHPTEYTADLVVELPQLCIIIEIQRGRDPEKRYSWPVYIATLRARKQKPVHLLVIALDPGVAQWLRTPIALGPPGFILCPTVLGPEDIPIITEHRQAKKKPELAVLSAMAHGHTEHALQIGEAVLAGCASLDGEQGALYIDLMLVSLSEAARHILEDKMAQPYKYQSEFARKYFHQGEQKGIEKGREEGREEGATMERREGLVRLLTVKFGPISPAHAATIQAANKDQLGQWMDRLFSSPNLEQLLQP